MKKKEILARFDDAINEIIWDAYNAEEKALVATTVYEVAWWIAKDMTYRDRITFLDKLDAKLLKKEDVGG